MKVSSYVGFPDSSKTIPRDKFILAIEFLKIIDSNISTQETVSIFNLDTNKVQIKHYANQGSSQSATDQKILEIGRLAKKVRSEVNSDEIYMNFSTEKDGKVFLLEVSIPVEVPEKDENEQEKLNLEVKNEFQSEDTKELVSKLIILLKKHSTKTNALDIVIRSLENEVTIQSLSQALLSFNELIKDW